MAREKLDTDVRQEQIAQAALDLVAANGLRKLSVAAVARRIGLVPSALYRHFKGKDEIIDATLALVQRRLLGFATEAEGQGVGALEHLRSLLERHANLIRENRGIPQIIFSQDFFAGHPLRRKVVMEGLQRYLAQVAKIIERGKASGEISASVDSDAAALLFLGLIQPSALLWQISGEKFDVARQARRAWPLFAQALTGGKPHNQGEMPEEESMKISIRDKPAVDTVGLVW